MAIDERLLVSLELLETDHDRKYWLSRPYSSAPKTRSTASAADVLISPWEKFRGDNDLFPQGTSDFFKFIEKKLPKNTVAIAMDEDKYKEITLHAHEFRLPTLLLKEALVAVVVGIAVEYLLHMRADPVKDIAQFEAVVESASRPCIAIRYKGPVGQLADRVLSEINRCFVQSASKDQDNAKNKSKNKINKKNKSTKATKRSKK